MTSAINYAAINTNYPVSGQDNNSQGFRTNFLAIQAGLETASTEITDLQDTAVVKGTSNTLTGTTLVGGKYSENSLVHFPGGIATTSQTVDLTNGPVQSFTVSGTTNFNIANWRYQDSANEFIKLTLILTSNQSTAQTVTFSSTNLTARYTTGWSSLTVGGSAGDADNVTVVELWLKTPNVGSFFYVRKVAEYA